jgi:hypothetical protein
MVTIVRSNNKIERKPAAITRQTKKLGKGGPDFDTMFEDVQDPLADQALTGSFEEDINVQMNATLRAAIDARKALEERFRIADDPNFYFLACFQSVDQKQEFLQKVGLESCAEDQFINGLQLADVLGINLKIIEIPETKLRGAGKIKRFKDSDIL